MLFRSETIDPKKVSEYWLRSQDVSFVLDTFEAKSPFNIELDLKNTLMLGHSSGGYTALSLVGADFDMALMIKYCQSINAKDDLGCLYGGSVENTKLDLGTKKALKIEQKHSLSFKSKRNLKDKRITKVVVFDPALGQAVSAESLKQLDVPVLVVGSVDNDFLNFDFHRSEERRVGKEC